MTKRTKNNIYYPRGVISLILLPMLCIWKLNKYHAFDNYGIIEVTYWSPSFHKKKPIIFPKESHPERDYTIINLTRNDNEDNIKLDYAQLLI